jgi:hypothetical protein
MKLLNNLRIDLNEPIAKRTIHNGTNRIAPHTIVWTRSGVTPSVSAKILAAPLITRG